MWKIEHAMQLDALLELKPDSVSEFADRIINAEVLLEELEHGPFPLRKDFCEFLGIGESTLTGWLKADRIPRAAKVAYALVVGMGVLQNEISRLSSEARDLKILKDGEKYLVVRFPTGDTDVVAGKIVARDIADAMTARMFAASSRNFELLEEIYESQHDTWEEAWEYGGSSWFRDILNRLGKAIASKPDPDFGGLPSGLIDPDLRAAIRKPSGTGAADDSEPETDDQSSRPPTGNTPSRDAKSRGGD